LLSEITDNAEFWVGTVCPLMTHSGRVEIELR
jgi:hypothetical protein